MGLPNEQALKLVQPKGIATNVDQAEASSNVALEMRGFKEPRPGMIAERDPGTKHRYVQYPRSNANIPLMQFVGGYSLFNKLSDAEHDILVGYDDNNDSHVFVWTGNAWLELTEKVSAQVNGTIGAGIKIAQLDNITKDEFPYFPADDEFNGCIAVNKSTGNGDSFEITAIADNGSGFVRCTATGHTFSQFDVVFIRGARGTKVGSITGHILITSVVAGVSFDLEVAWDDQVLTVNPMATSARSILHIVDSTTASITLDTQVGPAGDGAWWNDDDEIDIFRFNGAFYGWERNLGDDLHIRWNSVEPSNKVNLLYGKKRDVLSPPVMYDPMRVGVHEDLELFHAWPVPGPQIEYPGGWSMEFGGAGLTPSRYEIGSPDDPLIVDAALGVDQFVREFIYEKDASEAWGMIQFRPASSIQHIDLRHLYIAVCVETDGYQISDPVLYAFIGNPGPTAGSIQQMAGIVDFRLHINPALMPKNVTAVHVYRAGVTEQDINSGLHRFVPASAYLHIMKISIAEDANADLTTGLAPYWEDTVDDNRGGFSRHTNSLALSPENSDVTSTLSPLDVDIGHVPTKDRVRYTPRYATRAARGQGSIVVIDKDDQELLLSSYSGEPDVVHQDDHFVDIAVDVQKNIQKLIMNSSGELLGLAFTNVTSQLTGLPTGVLAAFKTTEIEFFDVFKGDQYMLTADVYARDSITQTPFGPAWLGRTDAYMLPHGSAEPVSIGESIKNLLDGSLKCDDGVTERITDAYRKAAIMAWDYYYHHLWLHIQINKKDGSGSEYTSYRYSPASKMWIGDRKVNIGDDGRIWFFGTKLDATLSIGDLEGVRKYPNLTGNYPYEDDVNADESTGFRGIETKLVLSLGEIHGIIQRGVPTVMRIFQDGQSITNKARAEVRFRSHPHLRILDQQLLPVDEVQFDMGMESSLGALPSLQVEFELPTDELRDVLRWDIHAIEFQEVPQMIEAVR